MLEALSGKAYADNDGYVSAMEVFRYLEKNVPNTARRLAKGEQDPLLCGDLSKDIILTVDTQRINEIKAKREQLEWQRNEEIRLLHRNYLNYLTKINSIKKGLSRRCD